MVSTGKTEYAPDRVTLPGETLVDVLEAQGLSQADLAKRVGRTTKNINEVVKGKAPITPELALLLERVLGIDALFWTNLEQAYRASLARTDADKEMAEQVDWLRTLPVADMVRKGWVQKCRKKVEQVLECLRFFGVASVTQWEGVYRAPQAAFRMSPAFGSSPGPVAAWLRRGELLSQEIQCGSYDRNRFVRILTDLRGLTADSPREFVPKVVESCANAGVAVVFVPQVKGARCSGAARWLTPTKALIQLSLRYRTNDHLWFSFFHECGHIVLHPKKAVFVEADERQPKTTEELEADRFSADLLVPPADYQRLVSLGPHWSRSTVVRFASGVGVAPGIVVGRLQHDGLLPHTHLNGLKEKYEWTRSS